MTTTEDADPLKDLIPETAAEAVERFDDGETVFTVEMGGLGPGYEQAIQALVFEILRRHEEVPVDEDGTVPSDWARDTVQDADRELDLGGVTGAMAGAARHLAARYIRNGYRRTIDAAPDDRVIQVRRTHLRS